MAANCNKGSRIQFQFFAEFGAQIPANRTRLINLGKNVLCTVKKRMVCAAAVLSPLYTSL